MKKNPENKNEIQIDELFDDISAHGDVNDDEIYENCEIEKEWFYLNLLSL